MKFRESHLKPSETIIIWAEGYIGDMMGSGDKTLYNGVLIVTNERVAFYRKGLLGEVVETIPLKQITSIERKSMMGHRTICLHTSHDQLEFKTFEKKEQKLFDAIESGRENSTSKVESISIDKNDLMDTLKKLAELKELGIISNEEFQSKKSDLLTKL